MESWRQFIKEFFVFLLIKNYLLLFGSFILPYIRRLVECVDFNKKKKERNLKSIKFLSNFVLTVPNKCFLYYFLITHRHLVRGIFYLLFKKFRNSFFVFLFSDLSVITHEDEHSDILNFLLIILCNL